MTINSSKSHRNIKINDDIKEEINRFDIKELIESETGQQFRNDKILCPLHDEKTASFVIYPATNSFNCFGCGVGGDIIRFIELYKGLEFQEAIRYLAQKYNIDLQHYSEEQIKEIKQQREEKQIIYDIYSLTLEYAQSRFKQEHIDYLVSRGFELETIKKAKIGYLNGDLLKYLRSKGYDDDSLYKTGLFTKDKKTGKIKDMFYNRLLIPYLEGGQPVYFTGRTLNNDDNIKYLNLKHTSPYIVNPLFKGRLEGNNTLILVEGELDTLATIELTKDCDVIGLGKAGLSQQKKEDLFKLVRRYDDVVIIYDTDDNKAGIKGAIQTAKTILNGTGLVCRVGQLDQLEGHTSTDIADYNREDKGLMSVIEKAIPFIDLIDRNSLIEEVFKPLIFNLQSYNDIFEVIPKVKEIYSIIAQLDEIYYSPLAHEIRNAVEKITGSKTTLGTQQNVVSDIKKERDKGKNGQEFNPTEIAKDVIRFEETNGNKWAYVLIREKGLFYFYNDKQGYWKLESETYFKNAIRTVLREHNESWENTYKIREVLEANIQSILSDPKNKERFDAGINPDLDLINLKNGMLDWRTGELKEHDPDYYSLFQMNVNYNPKADCPNWKKALKDWIPDTETIKFIQEFSGYCLLPDTSYHKAVILHGGGKNGKSTFLEVLKAMYGKENCGVQSLEQICQRFGTIGIKDKLVNICPDIDPTYIENSATLKSIIAGEEIVGEWKGKDPLGFYPVARLMFSANELPRTRDKSNGWLRRIEIIDFPNKFDKTKDNLIPNLKDKLSKELDGIFNWSLEGLRRLKKQGYFTLSNDMKQAKEDYQKENDTIASFVEELCEIGADYKEPSQYLFREYKNYCKDSNLQPVNAKVFSRTLGNLGFKKATMTVEVCTIHKKYNCDECVRPITVKKRKVGFRGIRVVD